MLQCVYYVNFTVMHIIPNSRRSKVEIRKRKESKGIERVECIFCCGHSIILLLLYCVLFWTFWFQCSKICDRYNRIPPALIQKMQFKCLWTITITEIMLFSFGMDMLSNIPFQEKLFKLFDKQELSP